MPANQIQYSEKYFDDVSGTLLTVLLPCCLLCQCPPLSYVCGLKVCSFLRRSTSTGALRTLCRDPDAIDRLYVTLVTHTQARRPAK